MVAANSVSGLSSGLSSPQGQGHSSGFPSQSSGSGLVSSSSSYTQGAGSFDSGHVLSDESGGSALHSAQVS